MLTWRHMQHEHSRDGTVPLGHPTNSTKFDRLDEYKFYSCARNTQVTPLCRQNTFHSYTNKIIIVGDLVWASRGAGNMSLKYLDLSRAQTQSTFLSQLIAIKELFFAPNLDKPVSFTRSGGPSNRIFPETNSSMYNGDNFVSKFTTTYRDEERWHDGIDQFHDSKLKHHASSLRCR